MRGPSRAGRNSSSNALRPPNGSRANSSVERPGQASANRESAASCAGRVRLCSHAVSSCWPASAPMVLLLDHHAAKRLGRSRSVADLGGLLDGGVALPALYLQHDVLQRYRVGVRVQFRQRLVFGNPGAIDLVRYSHLAGLVKELQDEVLSEILERDLLAQAGVDLPNPSGPSLER